MGNIEVRLIYTRTLQLSVPISQTSRDVSKDGWLNGGIAAPDREIETAAVHSQLMYKRSPMPSSMHLLFKLKHPKPLSTLVIYLNHPSSLSQSRSCQLTEAVPILTYSRRFTQIC